MSTPFDINVPVGLNEDVVINLEDGSQIVGTPAELVEAVSANNVVGLHFNPAVIPDPNAPETAPTNVEPNADAAPDPSQTTGVDANPAPTPPAEDPVAADTAKLDEDVKKLEADEAAGKSAGK